VQTTIVSPITPERLDRLRAAAGRGPVLILTHDNPDPDSLASGKGLAALLRAWRIPSRLVYSGLVARAENRAMMAHLTPEWEHEDILSGLEHYSAIALVDSQPTAGNNRLSSSRGLRIVLDHHHPVREAIAQVQYADVRPEIGASVTLVYQHLSAAGVEPDPQLATAMFYGLKTDTQGLSRGAGPADEAVYLELLSRADRAELVRVENSGLPRHYFRAFSNGLNAARVHGQAVIAELGVMDRPDLPAEMADLLLRLENTRAALCLGQHDGTLHVSLRLKILDQDAGLLIQRIILPPGKAGGHGTIAGGQVPIVPRDLARVMAEIEARFLDVMGESAPATPLL
jgi:nanoRNase/pAp phosphatase (c-di-AMP/oligoRNAs hydrolase)